jgi:hypothetical protein
MYNVTVTLAAYGKDKADVEEGVILAINDNALLKILKINSEINPSMVEFK